MSSRLIPRDNSYVPRLTIYIPTIGRDSLAALLESIDIQLADPDVMARVDVWVSDNSAGRAEAMCLPYRWCNYERQSHDIGVDANVMRAAVVGMGEFVWIIGDDDWILAPDLPREGQTDFRSALQRILDTLDRDLDRLILLSPQAVPHLPLGLEDKVYSARELFETVRDDASLLIAATLVSANIYNRKCIDVSEALRHWDSYYNFSWACSGAWSIRVLPEPVIGVGWTEGCSIPDARRVWQDYLDGLTIKAGCMPIPITAAARWNFASLAQRADRLEGAYR